MNELQFIKDNFFRTLVIRVVREGEGGTAASAHVSERQAQSIKADYTISAPAGDVKGLQDQAVAIAAEWLGVEE